MTIRKSTLFGLLTLFWWGLIPFLYFERFDFIGHSLGFYAVLLFIAGLTCAAIALTYFLKKKISRAHNLIICGSIGTLLWVVVAWLYITVPLFVINALPDLLPLSVFAFVLFVSGLLLLTMVAASVTRLIAPRLTWTVILAAASLIVLYNLSPLAPAWPCFGKHLYVAVANASGGNCTTTCTSNQKKPCGGWSSCWNKTASCSASGKDQDGRPCQGCCFSCDVVCEPPPSNDNPPAITSGVTCTQWGSGGWCIGNETLDLTASDPQGYTLTISGDINGSPFTCPTGTTCNQPLPGGTGVINYTVKASQSGMSTSGSTTWKLDAVAPVLTPNMPVPTGSNGWFKTTPVAISVSGSDTLSGLASTQVSVNGGAWQSNVTLISDGVYALNFRATDNAGNTVTASKAVSIDTSTPTLNVNVSGTLGANGWYVSQAVVSASATDSLSGVNTILISDNGGPGKPSPLTLSDGVHTLKITAIDQAGNSKSILQTVNVDTSGPVIAPSAVGTSGTNGWYRSAVDLSATASDALSGVQGSVEVSLDNGISWTSLPVNLMDEVYPVVLRVHDNAGNVSTSSMKVMVDTVSPTFTISTSGMAGNSPWYLSPATTVITPSDEGSGVDHVAYNQNNVGWQNGFSMVSNDGSNTISIHVYDQAGNMASGSVAVNVDTVPPVIIPSISGTSGVNAWLVSPGTVAVSVSDLTSGVTGNTDVSLNAGATWQTVPLTLNDGVYDLTFRAFDAAGNQGSASLSASIDTTLPTLNFAYAGTLGSNGWYVSTVKVSPSVSDLLSGVEQTELRVNGGGWESSIQLSDGIYTLDAYATDKAGNTKAIADTIRIDTTLPSSNYTSHTSMSLVSGLVHLAGLNSDSNGLQSEEISLDGGVTWQATTLSNSGWAYDWNSASVPNGTYTIYIRATDVAGNQEVPIPLVLVVDNFPPHVTITKSWWIWESGELHVSPNTFAIQSVTIKISDPQKRWPAAELTYDPGKPSGVVMWDRRFPGGFIAPMGNYRVEVTVCDLYRNCASDKGQIKIPILALVPPAAATPTQVILAPTPTGTTPITTETVVVKTSVTPMPVLTISEQPATPQKSGFVSDSAWVVLVLGLLALLFGALYVLDPRPKALRSLASAIHQFNKE